MLAKVDPIVIAVSQACQDIQCVFFTCHFLFEHNICLAITTFAPKIRPFFNVEMKILFILLKKDSKFHYDLLCVQEICTNFFDFLFPEKKIRIKFT